MRSSRSLALVAIIALGLLVSSGIAGAQRTKAQATKATAAKIKIGYINLSDAASVRRDRAQEHRGRRQGERRQSRRVRLEPRRPEGDQLRRAASRRRECRESPNFQLDSSAAPSVCAAGPKVPVVAIDIHQPPCETVFFGANNIQAGKLDGVALGAVREEEVELQGRRGALAQLDHAAGNVVSSTRERHARRDRAVVPRAQGHPRRDGRHDQGSIQPFTDTLTGSPVLTTCSSSPPTTTRRTARSRPRSPPAGWTTSTSAPRAATRRRGRRCAARRRSSTGSTTPRTSRSDYGATIVPTLVSLIEGQKEPKVIIRTTGDHPGEHPEHLPERLQVALAEYRESGRDSTAAAPAASGSRSAASRSSTESTSTPPPARSSRCSARTAPASRRSSGSSPATTRRTPARSRSTASTTRS